MRSWWASSMLLFLFLAIVAVPASAQIGMTEMTGTVSDGTGAVLPGVTITATQIGQSSTAGGTTGVVRTAVSGADGRYAFTQLPVGRWTFEFALDGFDSARLEVMELNVGQRPTINVTMQLAGVAETITVQAETPVIETTRSELSHTVQDVQVEELPVLGRDWLGFALLAPGVKSDGAEGSQDSAPVAGIGIGRQDKVLIDGADVNNRSTSTGIDIKISKETIAEFEVKTNQFDAQLGQSGTSVTQAVTKSGTDSFHGSGFYYRRNGSWNSPDFFTGVKDEAFKQDQVGGVIGGPVVPSKAYFFFSYEWQNTPRTCSSNSGIVAIDSQQVGCGDERNLWFIRGDVQINQNHRAAIRYNKATRLRPHGTVGGGTVPGHSIDFDFDFDRFNFSLDSVIGGNKVNRFMYNNLNTDRFFSKRGETLPESRVQGGITTAGPTQIFPGARLGGAIGSGFENPDYWSIRDDFSTFFSKGGDHNLKFGGYLERAKLQGFFLQFQNGAFTYDQDPANLQTCCTSEIQADWDKSQFPEAVRFQQKLGDPDIDTTQNFYSLYVQDDWSINEKLTLNLGMRFDLEKGSLFNDQPDAILQPEFSDDTDNFQPRIGFAYDIKGDARTIIRGGLGRFSSQAFLNIALLVQQSNRREELEVSVTNDGTNPNFNEDPLQGRTFEDFQAAIGEVPIDIAIFEPGTEIPDLWSFTIGVAREVGPSMAVEIDYTHQRTNNQFLTRETNIFFDEANNRPFPVVSGNFPELGGEVVGMGRPDPAFNSIREFRNEAKARYNGLSIAFTRRFINNWSAGATYLLSGNEDNASQFDRHPSNPFDVEDEYGTSLHDQRHRFTANWVWQLPYEFLFSGIVYSASGQAQRAILSGADLYGVAPQSRGLIPRPTCGLEPRIAAACAQLGIPDGARIPRNSIRSDSVFRVDFRFAWRARISDGAVSIEPSFEVFNVFNRENYDPRAYGTNLGSGAFGQPGRSSNLPYLPRNIQLGVIVRF